MNYDKDTVFPFMILVSMMLITDPLAQWIEVNMNGGTEFENFILGNWILIWTIIGFGIFALLVKQLFDRLS